MLSREQRLRDKDLFQKVFTRGKRLFCGEVSLLALPIKDARLIVGVTFKQAAFPRSVTRHRYKRRTLAWMRDHACDLPVGKVLVVHFQKPFPLERGRKAIPQALTQLFTTLV